MFKQDDQLKQSTAVKEYWNGEALTKVGDSTSWSDSYMLRLEENAILAEIPDNCRILDVGCGIGRTLFHILSQRAGLCAVGIDYINDFIKTAKSNKVPYPVDVQFFCRDIFSDGIPAELEIFDIIVSERFLINLPDEESQFRILSNMLQCLKNNGKLVIIEATKEGLAAINGLRKEYGMSPLEAPWFNRYISIERLRKTFDDCCSEFVVKEFASSYFLITRFLKEKLGSLCLADPLAPTNFLAHLVPNIGNFGVHKLIVLTKR